LLYIAEVIEEHTKLAKLVGQRLIFAVVAFHVALLFWDHLPIHLVLLGIVCHLTYYTNLSAATWPFISLTSLKFLASCCLVLVDHFAWFFYFAERAKNIEDTLATRYRTGKTPYRPAWDTQNTRRSQANEPLSFMDVATFFGICVWLVPFFLFLSLSANDNVLPSQGDYPYYLTCNAQAHNINLAMPLNGAPVTPAAKLGMNLSINTPAAQGLPRASILKSLLINPLLSLVPRLNRGQGRSSRSQRDGLIASPRPQNLSGDFSPRINYSPMFNQGAASPHIPGSPLGGRFNGVGPFNDGSPVLGLGRPPPPKRSQTSAAAFNPSSPPLSSNSQSFFENGRSTSSSSKLHTPGSASDHPGKILRRVPSGMNLPTVNSVIDEEDHNVAHVRQTSLGTPSRSGSPRSFSRKQA